MLCLLHDYYLMISHHHLAYTVLFDWRGTFSHFMILCKQAHRHGPCFLYWIPWSWAGDVFGGARKFSCYFRKLPFDNYCTRWLKDFQKSVITFIYGSLGDDEKEAMKVNLFLLFHPSSLSFFSLSLAPWARLEGGALQGKWANPKRYVSAITKLWRSPVRHLHLPRTLCCWNSDSVALSLTPQIVQKLGSQASTSGLTHPSPWISFSLSSLGCLADFAGSQGQIQSPHRMAGGQGQKNPSPGIPLRPGGSGGASPTWPWLETQRWSMMMSGGGTASAPPVGPWLENCGNCVLLAVF